MKFNMLGDANHAGPVRLSDVYSSAVGSAKDGVAASQRALYDAYNSLNSRINNDQKATYLTLTRTNNNYVNAEDFARLVAIKKNGVLYIQGNLGVDQGSLSDFYEIGRISGWNALYSILLNVAGQDSSGTTMTYNITSNGIIYIYSPSFKTTWYRFCSSVPCA